MTSRSAAGFSWSRLMSSLWNCRHPKFIKKCGSIVFFVFCVGHPNCCGTPKFDPCQSWVVQNSRKNQHCDRHPGWTASWHLLWSGGPWRKEHHPAEQTIDLGGERSLLWWSPKSYFRGISAKKPCQKTADMKQGWIRGNMLHHAMFAVTCYSVVVSFNPFLWRSSTARNSFQWCLAGKFMGLQMGWNWAGQNIIKHVNCSFRWFETSLSPFKMARPPVQKTRLQRGHHASRSSVCLHCCCQAGAILCGQLWSGPEAQTLKMFQDPSRINGIYR